MERQERVRGEKDHERGCLHNLAELDGVWAVILEECSPVARGRRELGGLAEERVLLG